MLKNICSKYFLTCYILLYISLCMEIYDVSYFISKTQATSILNLCLLWHSNTIYFQHNYFCCFRPSVIDQFTLKLLNLIMGIYYVFCAKRILVFHVSWAHAKFAIKQTCLSYTKTFQHINTFQICLEKTVMFRSILEQINLPRFIRRVSFKCWVIVIFICYFQSDLQIIKQTLDKNYWNY